MEYHSPEQFTKDIRNSRELGSFLLATVKLDVDVERMRHDYKQVVARAAIRATAREGRSVLRSVSLTHRPDAVEPYYDGNNTQYNPHTNEKLFKEADFTEFNEDFKDTVFYDIYQAAPFTIGRMRLNLLPPATVFDMHRDSAPRAQMAINTNTNCYIIGGSDGEAQAHHIPADGNIHIFDTTRPHTAFNASAEDRHHLIMSLVDEEYFLDYPNQ